MADVTFARKYSWLCLFFTKPLGNEQMNDHSASLQPLHDQNSVQSSLNNSSPLLPMANKVESPEVQGVDFSVKKRRGPLVWTACLAALVIVVLAVVLPVYFAVIKPNPHKGNSDDGTASSTDSGSLSNSSSKLTTGGDGSTITTQNGTTFTYTNKFGGFCESSSSFSIT